MNLTQLPPIPHPEIANAGQEFVIRTTGVSKEFGGEYAVCDLSMQVPQGKIFGFIGPSGSGKTTTVRLLTGILGPSSGEIQVLGMTPTKFRQRVRERIGYMPQLFVLYPELTVWENLNFAASIYGMGLRRGKRLTRALDFVELTDHRQKQARNISGGMQRRLALAATLVHDPELIFLDEPTAGIDPMLRRKFWDHFKELQNQGRTLFITTQYVGEAAYCDLVGIMAEGKLLYIDTPDRLRREAFGGDVVDLATTERLDHATLQKLRALPFVRSIRRMEDTSLRIVVDDASTASPELLEWLKGQNLPAETIREYRPPFDDVFVELVKRGAAA